MPEPSALPCIFDFTDFRSFLAGYYRARKAGERKFSHRFIAMQAGVTSTGWFSDILKGRCNLSGSHIVKLSRLLKLDPAEADYFDVLVRYDQAGSLEEKESFYRKLVSLKGVKPELVGLERFEFYSKWYHSVIREMFFFHPFESDYSALARKLIPAIRATEARKSVRLLEAFGFIKREAGGAYRVTSKTLKKDTAFKAVSLSSFHKANARLGFESLDRFPKEERDISSLALSLSAEGFRKAKEEIRQLREKLLALTAVDANPDKVYQCNFHMFPVTR